MRSSRQVPRDRRGVSQWALTWRRFRRNKAAIAGLATVVFLGSLAVFDRLVVPYPPNCLVGLQAQCPTPSWQIRASPSIVHPFGTNILGQDVYSQVVYGTRAAFLVGFGTTAISMAIATLVGLAAGYYGGKIDNILMRITEVFLVLPFFLVLLVFLRILFTISPTAKGGLWIVILIIGVFSWPAAARMIRGEAIRVKGLEFIKASREIGASNRRILFRHILPNVLHVIIVLSTLQVAGAILVEASVSFLGFGDPNTITWGQQLSHASEAVKQAWWEGVLPGVFITVLVMGFNLLGNGLRDALDPRMGE